MYGCIEDCKRGEPSLLSSFSSSFASYHVAAVVVVTVDHDNAGEKVCSRILGLVAVDSSRISMYFLTMLSGCDERAGVARMKAARSLCTACRISYVEGLSNSHKKSRHLSQTLQMLRAKTA